MSAVPSPEDDRAVDPAAGGRLADTAGRRWDLVCIGDPCLDQVFAVEALPALGGKCVGRSLGPQPGGTAANVACAASRLGARVAMLGAVGDDAAGVASRASLLQHGVDDAALAVLPGRASSTAVVMIARGGERAIVYAPIDAPPPAAGAVHDVLAQARVAYTMPYDLAALARTSASARALGTWVAVDLEPAVAPDRAGLLERCALADIAFFNEAGFVAATGRAPSAGAIAGLLRGRTRTVVVTRGECGAVAMDERHFALQPALAGPVVDTTGAGDSFNAAFLCARLEGRPLAAALRFACAAASCTVAAIGARAGLPDRARVEALVPAQTGDGACEVLA